MNNFDTNTIELLAKNTFETHLGLSPVMKEKYTERQQQLYLQDIGYSLTFLKESLQFNQPSLYEEYIAWCRDFFPQIGVEFKEIKKSQEILADELLKYFGKEGGKSASDIILQSLNSTKTSIIPASEPFINENLFLSDLAEKYLDYLVSGKRQQASELIMNEVKSGTSIRTIYEEVFQVSQYEVGRLWQTNKISVAQEHYCTAATQLIMSQLYPYLFSGKPKNKKLIATCVQGEMHEMGIRMVSDFFEMEDWDTQYLGANMPDKDIVDLIKMNKPDLVAISVTMTFNLGKFSDLIKKIRAIEPFGNLIPIIAGGYPFNTAPELVTKFGINATANSAREALEKAKQLINK